MQGTVRSAKTLSILPCSQVWEIKVPRSAATAHSVTCASTLPPVALTAPEFPAVSGGCSPPAHLTGGGGHLV